MKLIELLESRGACIESLDWAKTQPDMKSLWNNSESGHGLIWLLDRLHFDNKKAFQWIALECAKSIKHLMQDQRSLKALEVTELYLNGEATMYQLTGVKNGASSAYNGTANAAAYYAALSAYYAILVASACTAAYTCVAAHYCSRAAARAACTYITERKKQADIVREFVKWDDIKELFEVNK